MANRSLSAKYHNWPDAVESKLPYNAPPKGANPSVKGAILTIGAPLVEKLGFVSKFLYGNAGFSQLRKLNNMEDVKMRFDPTVTPAVVADSDPAGLVNPADAQVESKSLLKKLGEGEAPLYWGIKDYHEAYKSGRLTPTQVVEALLPLIRRDVKARNSHSVAFLTTLVDKVQAAAAASTQRWADGKPLGLLDGIPLAVKDEVDLKDYPQTFGTQLTVKKASEATSWCVEKWEEAGAIIVGKTNMHEIGMDTTNNNYITGTPRNPYNQQYYTGGSSGGSAYSVSAGLVPVALGTDGGGSIRIPACYCGVYGLKTSHSRVSCHPTPDIAGTTAVAGPIAGDMHSLEVAYRVMATPDPSKSSSAHFSAPRRPAAGSPRKKILGIFKPWYSNADPEVHAAVQKCVDWLVAEKGYEVVDIHIPLTHEGQLAHALTIMMEARTGVPLHSFSKLQPANRILMALAGAAPAPDFLAAQRVRQMLSQHLAHLYEEHGEDLVIVTPTTPNAGWFWKSKADLKKGISDGDMTIRNMQYVWMANFLGNPAIQFPVGYAAPPKGIKGPEVPIGFMGMGIWGGEEGLIELGYEGEQYLADVVGRRRPEIWTDMVAKATGEENDLKEEKLAEEEKKEETVSNGSEVKPVEAKPIETVPAPLNGAAEKVEPEAAEVAEKPAANANGTTA
jgi:Asp-tRNA(Asn)/Glu-tRNA(Gln) amidotransferase A subunit family amidase